MIVLIILLFAVALVLAALATIGKFSRVERNLQGGFSDLQIENKNLATKVKTLEGKLEALEKNHTHDNSTLAGSMEQIENRIGQIYETEEGLRKDINLLFKADKEHPVLTPATSTTSKGGRPRKDG